ncbi:hypothetical protein F1559_001871 [Cyanidiococcus yangmingshanensis]|uniref:Uncharacterized protein n=1 Tax=Cyanidiococcus yangmingshanensis TaxID=2690220 RepID=A0A7J7IP53_9RHOD|nr:hypothetical protein F1559_001871 [Cyanidiococcus yangmingshanensis]
MSGSGPFSAVFLISLPAPYRTLSKSPQTSFDSCQYGASRVGTEQHKQFVSASSVTRGQNIRLPPSSQRLYWHHSRPRSRRYEERSCGVRKRACTQVWRPARVLVRFKAVASHGDGQPTVPRRHFRELARFFRFRSAMASPQLAIVRGGFLRVGAFAPGDAF